MHTTYTAEHPPEGPVVELTHATFTNRHGYDATLEDVTFKVEQGELVMILMEQGCVEYPLADILSGLQTCSEGDVRVFGQALADLGADSQAGLFLQPILYRFVLFFSGGVPFVDEQTDDAPGAEQF